MNRTADDRVATFHAVTLTIDDLREIWTVLRGFGRTTIELTVRERTGESTYAYGDIDQAIRHRGIDLHGVTLRASNAELANLTLDFVRDRYCDKVRLSAHGDAAGAAFEQLDRLLLGRQSRFWFPSWVTTVLLTIACSAVIHHQAFGRQPTLALVLEIFLEGLFAGLVVGYTVSFLRPHNRFLVPEPEVTK